MKLSEVKPKDCITVWYGCNAYMQSYANYILEECLTLRRGFYLTYNEDEKIKRDITIEKWLDTNKTSK